VGGDTDVDEGEDGDGDADDDDIAAAPAFDVAAITPGTTDCCCCFEARLVGCSGGGTKPLH
jgi:hypothetical protein